MSSAAIPGKNLLSLRLKSGHLNDAQRPAIRVSLTGIRRVALQAENNDPP
jgi:hypothetical protein